MISEKLTLKATHGRPQLPRSCQYSPPHSEPHTANEDTPNLARHEPPRVRRDFGFRRLEEAAHLSCLCAGIGFLGHNSYLIRWEDGPGHEERLQLRLIPLNLISTVSDCEPLVHRLYRLKMPTEPRHLKRAPGNLYRQLPVLLKDKQDERHWASRSSPTWAGNEHSCWVMTEIPVAIPWKCLWGEMRKRSGLDSLPPSAGPPGEATSQIGESAVLISQSEQAERSDLLMVEIRFLWLL